MSKVVEAETSSLRQWRVDQGQQNELPVTIWAWQGRNSIGRTREGSSLNRVGKG